MLWRLKKTRFVIYLKHDPTLIITFISQVLRAQLELAQLKQEIDRKIAEKEEEFENTR